MKGSLNVNVSLGCRILGYSRQAFYKPKALLKGLTGLEEDLEAKIKQERIGCPGKGVRAIYFAHAKKIPVGRDRAEKLARELGLTIRHKPKYIRTTQAGRRLFSNLLVNMKVTGVNQVWQSDLTYWQHGNKVLYLILIIDVYSQRIVGYGAFERAFAENFRQVLNQAVRARQKAGETVKKLILHSDGGKQYESKCFTEACRKHGIKQSMCYFSYENPYAEKANDLIKNRYLKYWKPSNLKDLKKTLLKAVIDHNYKQPKMKLNNLSPVDFEWNLKNPKVNTDRYELKLKPSQPKQGKLIVRFT